jgi:hypothetical protein
MPELYRESNWTINVFIDHNPPHFHVITPTHEVLIRIDNFEVYAGRVPRSVMRAALKWATAHKDEVVACWNAQNRGRGR